MHVSSDKKRTHPWKIMIEIGIKFRTNFRSETIKATLNLLNFTPEP